MSNEPTETTIVTPDLVRTEYATLMHSLWSTIGRERDDREPTAWEIGAIASRGSVRETILAQSHFGDTIPGGLADAIAWLQDHLAAIPEPHRHTAKLNIESEGGYEGEHHVEVTLTYDRPETDAEWKRRRLDVERRKALNDARRTERERTEFERLSAKFSKPQT